MDCKQDNDIMSRRGHETDEDTDMQSVARVSDLWSELSNSKVVEEGERGSIWVALKRDRLGDFSLIYQGPRVSAGVFGGELGVRDER